jgi:hypothetical protein
MFAKIVRDILAEERKILELRALSKRERQQKASGHRCQPQVGFVESLATAARAMLGLRDTGECESCCVAAAMCEQQSATDVVIIERVVQRLAIELVGIILALRALHTQT